MNDLADFLLARITEDEEKARDARVAAWAQALAYDSGMTLIGSGGEVVATHLAVTNAEHIARWDPARVLAKCAADRRIVALCQVPDPHTAEEAGDGCTECAVLYTLALPYADHPDYDESWRP